MRKGMIVLAAVVAAAVLAVGTVPAESVLHLKLDASTPEADQVVTEPPTKIFLDFSQAPEMAISRVTVAGGAGEAKVGKITRHEEDDTILIAPLEQPLTAGAYTVSWVTSSADLHPIRGEFSFTVRPAR